MQQGSRIAAVLAVTTVATVAEAATAPALSVPVDTTTVSTPTVSVAPVTTTPTVTVPPVSPPPKVTPAPGSVPPVVSNPSKVTVPPVPNKVTPPPVPKGALSGGGSGSGTSGSGGGSVGGVVKGVQQALPKASGGGGGIVARSAPGAAGTVVGGAGGGGYSTGTGNSGLSAIFGGTPGGPGGGFSGLSGFAGPGGFGGGPGSPAAFALGIPRGPSWTVTGAGNGGVSAFAAAVGALAGCFYVLTPFEQQVLTIRSGIDGRRALSRSQVAAVLGTTPAAIRATERNAFRELRGAARTTGCMPVPGAGPANALTAFIGGPFGPPGYVTPGVPPTSRVEPGISSAQQTRLASTSFADKLATLQGGGKASLSVLMIIAVMLTGALAALLVEARRSVH